MSTSAPLLLSLFIAGSRENQELRLRMTRRVSFTGQRLRARWNFLFLAIFKHTGASSSQLSLLGLSPPLVDMKHQGVSSNARASQA